MSTPEPPHRIALVHETPLIRSALVRLLQERGHYHVMADVPDPPGLKRALALGPPPDLVLLSLEWAHAQRCTLLHWLATHSAEARVLVVGPEPDARTLLHLLWGGAHGFCCTRQGLDHLYTILEHVRAGALHYPAHLYTRLRGLLPRPTEHTAQPPTLSARQRTLLGLLAGPDDLSYAAIADRMNVGICTVHKYRAQLFKRYGIASKAGLVKLAVELGVGRIE